MNDCMKKITVQDKTQVNWSHPSSSKWSKLQRNPKKDRKIERMINRQREHERVKNRDRQTEKERDNEMK